VKPSAHRSLATLLAWLLLGLVAYASLFPFSEWRWPVGPWFEFLWRDWPRHWTWFDVVLNLLGYIPLGALLCIGALRQGHSLRGSIGLSLCVPMAWSLLMETLQNLIPQRVPSNVDWALNSAGAALGVALAVAAHRAGWISQWSELRARWWQPRSGFGLTLLVLWPLGLLFPLPAPMGMGQALAHVHALLLDAAEGSALLTSAAEWHPLLASLTERLDDLVLPLGVGQEFWLTCLGMLSPCLIAFSVARPGWRRAVLAVGGLSLGLGVSSLSAALNFGPPHALAWMSDVTVPALAIAALLAFCVMPLDGQRTIPVLALIVLVASVVLVHQAPADPYFASALESLERVRYVHLFGLAQWVGWLWPFLAIAHCLSLVFSAQGRVLKSAA
jgi:VanZ family protein